MLSTFLYPPENAGMVMPRKIRRGLKFGEVSAHCLKAALLISLIENARPDPLHPDTPHLLEEPRFRDWIRAFAEKVRVTIEVCGEAPAEGALVVGNHISWLDTIILSQVQHYAFVAKAEVEQWPLVGKFSRQMKTVFIDRHNKFAVYRTLPLLESILRSRRSVFVFPEGTTSTAEMPLPFHPMLFEVAVRTGAPVQPVSIEYLGANNSRIACVGYVDDDSVFDTLHRMLDQPIIRARLSFAPSLSSRRLDRKQLAVKSRQWIIELLQAE